MEVTVAVVVVSVADAEFANEQLIKYLVFLCIFCLFFALLSNHKMFIFFRFFG